MNYKQAKRALYRPIIKASVPLPFSVRSVGHYRLTRSFCEKHQKRLFLELFWGIKGQGIFRHEGKNITIDPEHIFIYMPGDNHDIEKLSKTWEYRWFTIDGNLNKAIVDSFNLPRHVAHAGPCPEELFMELEQNIHDISPFGQRANVTTAMKLLTYACGIKPAQRDSNSNVEQCLKIIKEQYSDPNLSITRMADTLSLHRTTITRLFKQKMDLSPIQYLTSYRTQKAMSMLKETALSIQEITDQNGFANPNYFCHVIKKATGQSPTEFRKG